MTTQKQKQSFECGIDYYEPTLGIYNRCTRIEGFGRLHCASFIQRGYQANYTESFPVAWQATLVFFSIGLCLLVLTLVTSIVGWCARSIRRKSIFSIGGSVQALSGTNCSAMCQEAPL